MNEKKKAGRPRKGEALRIPITFSVDPEVYQQAVRLRNSGFPLGYHVSALITEKHDWYFAVGLEEFADM